MGKPKYVDCWTYPKPVLDEKLGEIKTDISTVTEQVETLSESFETLAGNLADEYSSSSTYAVGDLCIYENELYKCTTAIATAEEWTAGHWTQTTVADTFDNLSGEVETLSETAETINANISDEYDSTATYSVGDLCIYENELYKCTTAIETAEEWTVGHWTQTSISDEIAIDDTVILLTTESEKFTIDNSATAKKCAYTIRNKICYAVIYLHCVAPASASSEEICNMPPISANIGTPVNFLLRDFYSTATLPGIIQDGKLYVRGGTANTDYCACLSYPID